MLATAKEDADSCAAFSGGFSGDLQKQNHTPLSYYHVRAMSMSMSLTEENEERAAAMADVVAAQLQVSMDSANKNQQLVRSPPSIHS